MRWIKTSPDTLECQAIGARITRHPDRFVVQVGEHTRDHYSLVGARMLAERMWREINQFDRWGERPPLTGAELRYRAGKIGRMMGRRAVMASTVAIVAGLGGVLMAAL